MSGSFSIPDVRLSSGFLFWKTSTLWQRGIRDLLEPLGLTHTQYILLASLRWLGGASQAELARHTGCDSMTVSAVVRALADRGRVLRDDNPADRRAKRLQIAQEGVDLIDRAVPLVEAFDRRFFEEKLGPGAPDFLTALGRLAGGEGKPPRRSVER